MKTEYFNIDPLLPEQEVIALAANKLKQLEVVAFPTETVYGIGAAAFSSAAVRKVFLAKKRSFDNPLLIHISDIEQVQELVTEVPEPAKLLMGRFWPGPLSIILNAKESLPLEVRAGKLNVGLRMPSHPVARALISAAGPIAATSANLSGRPSPCNAEHVRKDLDGRIAAVLDAGKTGAGLESTLVDFTGGCYKVLRRGGVSVEELEGALGTKLVVLAEEKNYNLKIQIIISKNRLDFRENLNSSLSAGKRIAVVGDKSICELQNKARCYKLDFLTANADLYSILRDAEENGVEVLLFTPLPKNISGAGLALLDRIRILSKS